MTIFRYKVCSYLAAAATLAALGVGASAKGGPVGPNCGNIIPQEERDCISRRIKSKERQLLRVYTKALVAVRMGYREYGSSDLRTDPKFLEQSQRDWRKFVDNDCKVRAAFGGGSNSSISDREVACFEEQLDQRLSFLDQLGDGSFGAK